MRPPVHTPLPHPACGPWNRKSPATAPDTLPSRFMARLSDKRRQVRAVVDREIERLGRVRGLLQDADAEVLLAAIDCLGSPSGAALWLTGPEALLGGATPLEAAALPAGKERVIRILLERDAAVPAEPGRP